MAQKKTFNNNISNRQKLSILLFSRDYFPIEQLWTRDDEHARGIWSCPSHYNKGSYLVSSGIDTDNILIILTFR
jgi:hypothetical protein